MNIFLLCFNFRRWLFSGLRQYRKEYREGQELALNVSFKAGNMDFLDRIIADRAIPPTPAPPRDVCTLRENFFTSETDMAHCLKYCKIENTLSDAIFQISKLFEFYTFSSTREGGTQWDVVYLGWPKSPLYIWAPKRGLGQWVQLFTWSPNKLWRSNSIFNLCVYLKGNP